MYKVLIGQDAMDVSADEPASVNGVKKDIQFINVNGAYQVTMDGQTHLADLVKLDRETKEVVLRMRGKKYAFQLKEPIDLMLDQLGMKSGAAKKLNHLKAPMPGLILKVIAEAGGKYKAGDPLLVLEAMKMENVFKAATDVEIKSIQIAERQSVEKGQVLIEFV